MEEALQLHVHRVARFFLHKNAFRIQPAAGVLDFAIEKALFAVEGQVAGHQRNRTVGAAGSDHGGAGHEGLLLVIGLLDGRSLGRLAIPPGHRHVHVVTHGDLNRALGAHDDLAHLRPGAIEVREKLVGADRRISQLLAVGIAVDQLDVVVNVAAVLERIQAAQAHHELGLGTEHPIGDIHLVRSQLGGQAAGELPEQAPVVYVGRAARLHRPQRAGLVDHVAMPLRMDVMHVAQDALVHHVLHHLVELAVAPLQTGLQNLFRPRVGKRAQLVHLIRLEYQALLAEDVPAAQQRIPGQRVMHVERGDDENGVEILAVQQLAVILVSFRIVADGRDAMVERGLLEVAQRHAAAGRNILEVLEQVAAAAAGADHAVLHLVVGGLHRLDRRRALNGGGHGGDCAGGFQ